MNTPHLLVHSQNLAPNVIVCGDPSRAQSIAELLQDGIEVAYHREYRTFTCSWQQTPVSVTSHGVGAGGAAICFEELIRAGAKRLIRVGTAGSYQPELTPGCLVVSVAAVSADGVTRLLVPAGFPAVADRIVVEALVQAAKKRNIEVTTGITLTMDLFYEGVVSFPHELYKNAGVLAVEMESAPLYAISSIRGVQAGAILALDGQGDADLANIFNPHTETVKEAIRLEAEIALDALAIMANKRS